MTDVNGKNQGAEGLEKPLERTISKKLEDAGEPPDGYSVSMSCDFLATSLPETEEPKRQVGQAIGDYVCILKTALQSGGDPRGRQTQLECGIVMHSQPFAISDTGEFILEDLEAAPHLRGWTTGDSTDTIKHCIAEKTEKIKDIICCYLEWRLVLVDHNVYSPGDWEDEWETIRDDLGDTKPWSEIVVLSLTEPSTHVDVI
ncbi:MAG: hypothetical protein OXO50_13985 [Caldilineaceae bacterium]|nr:hypothetical protein [Caldilineaceae bacterium]